MGENFPSIAVSVILRRDMERERTPHVLMGLRAGGRGAGHWEFPGGALRKGEAPLQAAARELWEETGLRALALRPSGWVFAPDSDGSRWLVLFFLGEAEGEAKRMEPDKCLGWKWVSWEAPPQPLMRGVRGLREAGWTFPPRVDKVRE